MVEDDGAEGTARTAAEIEAFLAGGQADSSRVTLRPVTGQDQDEFLGLVRVSVDLHHPWMSLPATPQEFVTYLGRFDVPPPNEGVRGLAAYRETWPPFFAWQAQGASFAIESLDVTAGEDVAFAHALLRCGTDEQYADDPGMRLRLTLGLRGEDGRWVVAHEHHSFPVAEPAASPVTGTGLDGVAAEVEVRQLYQRWFDSYPRDPATGEARTDLSP